MSLAIYAGFLCNFFSNCPVKIGSPLLCLLSLSLSPAWAQSLYWDTNGATAGTGAAGGTWNSGTNWSTNSGGTVATTGWVDGRAVIFAAGAPAGSWTSPVVISGSVETNSITFNNSLTGNQTITGGSITPTGTLMITQSAPAGSANAKTIESVIAGAGGLTKSGVGNLILGGANTYSGATTISGGTLIAAHNSALGTTAGSTTVAANSALGLQGGIMIASEALTLTGNGVSNGGALRNFSGDNTYAGAITLATASRIHSDADTLTISGTITSTNTGLILGGAGDIEVSGVIGLGTGALTKDGAGMVTLSGANTYIGATTINGGTLRVEGGHALSDTATVTLANTAGATLDLNGSNETIGALAGGGANGGDVTLGSGTLTTASNAGTTYAGVISGTGGIVKGGTGTFTLTGENIYTGKTTISAGTLSIGNGGATGSIVGDVETDSILQFNRSGRLTYDGNITGTGRIVKAGSGTLTLNGDNVLDTTTGNGTSGHSITVSAGVLVLNGGSYTANGTDSSGLVVNNSRAELTDTTITALNAGNPATGFWNAGVRGIAVSGLNGYVDATDVTIDATGVGVFVDGGAHFEADGLVLRRYNQGVNNQSSGNSAAGVLLRGTASSASVPQQSTANIVNSTITLDGPDGLGAGAGLYSAGNSRLTVSDSEVIVNTANSAALLAIENTLQAYTNGRPELIADRVIISTYGEYTWGLISGNRATVTASNLEVSINGEGGGGLWVYGGGTINSFEGIEILTTGEASLGFYHNNSSTAGYDGLSIETRGLASHGMVVQNNEDPTLPGYTSFRVDNIGKNLDVLTTGDGAVAFYVTGSRVNVFDVDDGGLLELTLDTGFLRTTGDNSQALLVTGRRVSADISNLEIRTVGIASHGIDVRMGGTLVLDGADVEVTGAGAHGLFTTLGTTTGHNNVEITNAVITSEEGDALHATAAMSDITLNSVSLQAGVGRDIVGIHGGSVVDLTFTSMTVSASEGGLLLNLSGGSELDFTADASILNGDIIAAADSTATVRLTNGSVLTGMIDPVHVVIDGLSAWSITASSLIDSLDVASGAQVNFLSAGGFKQLVNTGVLTGNGGVFTFNTDLGARVGDHVDIQGTSAGDHLVVVSNVGGAPTGPRQSLEIISTTDGVAQFSLVGGSVDAGMFQYVLRAGDGDAAGVIPDANNWYLVNLFAPSVVSQAVQSGAAVLASSWLDQLDNLDKRMGEVRLGALHDGEPKGDVWFRGYGQRIDIDASVTGAAFSERLHGGDVGGDKVWLLESGNRLLTGGFFGYGESTRRFRGAAGRGETEGVYAGLYATWLKSNGWYVDLVGKVQHFSSSFEAIAPQGTVSNGEYENWGVGGSIETGRRFELARGWFVEPQGQFAYTHVTGVDYATDNGIKVGLGGNDTWRARGTVVAGRVLETRRGLFIQPYGKVGVIHQWSDGGRLNVENMAWRPNLDGTNLELGVGLVVQLSAVDQLHFDYEATFGDKHEKPYGLTFGFRRVF